MFLKYCEIIVKYFDIFGNPENGTLSMVKVPFLPKRYLK